MLLETTKVPAPKSIGEITAELVKAGATAIQTTYEAGKPAGLTWSMRLYGQEVWFRLPVRVEPVFQKLLKRKISAYRYKHDALREIAERVAWRQLLMWVKIQMAMIDLDMVEFGQVFLPYVLDMTRDESVWDVFKGQRFKQLPPPQ